MKSQEEDPFDSLLNLEEHHYDEGYKAGYADGAAQSALEARVFGIEKGFEKFVAMGKLRRQAEIWAESYNSSSSTATGHQEEGADSGTKDSRNVGSDDNVMFNEDSSARKRVQGQRAQKESSSRLQRHIETLLLLTDPSTLDTSNTDDAVATFDDRLKRAQAKVKVIEHLVGEPKSSRQPDPMESSSGPSLGTSSSDIENLKFMPG